MVHGCTEVGGDKDDKLAKDSRELLKRLPHYARWLRCRVQLLAFDQRLFEYLTLYANPPWFTRLAERIGEPSTYAIPVALFCIFYFIKNRSQFLQFVVFLLLLLACSEATAHVLKTLVARPRPAVEWLIYVDPKALGFPSAHAVNTMALAVFLARWFGKSLWWFLLIPFIVGASRVVANYHYPLDVLGGWLLGWAVATLYWRLCRRFIAHAK